MSDTYTFLPSTGLVVSFPTSTGKARTLPIVAIEMRPGHIGEMHYADHDGRVYPVTYLRDKHPAGQVLVFEAPR